jgi:hypothetical protein
LCTQIAAFNWRPTPLLQFASGCAFSSSPSAAASASFESPASQAINARKPSSAAAAAQLSPSTPASRVKSRRRRSTSLDFGTTDEEDSEFSWSTDDLGGEREEEDDEATFEEGSDGSIRRKRGSGSRGKGKGTPWTEEVGFCFSSISKERERE